MYRKVTKKVPNAHVIFNGERQHDRWIYISWCDSLWIRDSVDYPTFNAPYSFGYIRNNFPISRTCGVMKLDFRITKQIEEFDEVSLFIDYNARSVMGMYMSTYYHCFLVNFASRYMSVDENTTFYNVPMLIEPPFTFENVYRSTDAIIYLDKLLLQHKFYPKYETILYPYETTWKYSSMKTIFESGKEEVNIFKQYKKDANLWSDGGNITLRRPRFLFSEDGKQWKKWNTSLEMFENVSPNNGIFFEYEEFHNKANTYTEYMQIPKNVWGDNRWYILNNNYILEYVISLQWFNDKLDTNHVIWIRRRNSKFVFLSSEI